MKTERIRIGEGQAKKLHEVADEIPGCTMNKLVERAVDLWLDVEYPVYREAIRTARQKLGREDRSPVNVSSHA